MARIILIVAIVIGVVAFALDVRSRAGRESMPHAYNAPHGGSIIRLGRHEAHLELLLDAASGKLTAYLLGPASKNAIGAKAQSFEIAITAGGEPRTLTFNAVPDPAVNSTSSDATRFEAQAEWLKRERHFKGQLTRLEIESTTFLHEPIDFPAGNEKP